MTNRIRQIVLACCVEHNDVSDRTIDVARDGEAPLFGVDGVLDSIDLVSLIVAVEQGIEDQLGVMVTLADAKAASQKSSPFRTVASLVAYATDRVDEESRGHG
jgi:D-alanine--poly(phosphoribitol) ligase subunit 2